MPSPFFIWAKMLWPCHSLKSSNINVIFKCDLLSLTSGSRLHETLADLSYKAYKTRAFLPILIVQSIGLHQPTLILHLITEASFPLALMNAYMFRSTRNAVTNTSSPQRPLFALLPPAVPSHKLHFQKQHLPILLSVIYQFQEQLTGNACKADSLTSSFFLLKTLLCCTDLWNLDNGLATALCKPHLPSQAMPPISHLPVSVCHLPLTYAQILKLWRKEPFSFGVCSTTHCTMKSWSFMWVSKCCSNVLQQSLTLGLDYVLHKASSTASRP